MSDIHEDEPLRPRSQRCPEPECQAGGECWRCDAEEVHAGPHLDDAPASGCTPGSTDEQLPAHILELLVTSQHLEYLSTACEVSLQLTRLHADLLHKNACAKPLSDQLFQWRVTMHKRCRLTNKFTGTGCSCDCHTLADEDGASWVGDTS